MFGGVVTGAGDDKSRAAGGPDCTHRQRVRKDVVGALRSKDLDLVANCYCTKSTLLLALPSCHERFFINQHHGSFFFLLMPCYCFMNPFATEINAEFKKLHTRGSA